MGLWHGQPADWGGAYFPCHGQHVTQTDAEGIAFGLERALRDIPSEEASGKTLRRSDLNPEWFATVPRPGVNCLEAFRGVRKDMLRAFILHCREEGGLWIY